MLELALELAMILRRVHHNLETVIRVRTVQLTLPAALCRDAKFKVIQDKTISKKSNETQPGSKQKLSLLYLIYTLWAIIDFKNKCFL